MWIGLRSSDFSFPSVSDSLTLSPSLIFSPQYFSLFFFYLVWCVFRLSSRLSLHQGHHSRLNQGLKHTNRPHAWHIYSPVRGQCRAPSAFIPTTFRKDHIFSFVAFSFSPGLLKISLVCGEKNVPSAERFLARLGQCIRVMTFSEKAPLH